MSRLNIQLIVGIFMIIGFFGFTYIAVKLGDLDVLNEQHTYTVKARFTSVSGLKPGADIEIAGVKVGKVANIKLDGKDYEAVVNLTLNEGVEVQEDSTASVRTSGLIGDRFINITPGGSDVYLKDGGVIEETEPSISLEELVSKYIFEKE